jgi:hypothetical protein
VFFKFEKSTRSFGIALSAAPGWIDIAVNNNYSHYVHNNIANFSGFVSGNNRNLYYRIEAESGDPDIKFIRFDTGGSSFGSPSTYFDLVAFGVSGCTDANATNYNPDATAGEGSCYFPVAGCTDANATNYNPDATVDDGSCESEPGDCQHASYSLKDKTLSIPVVELPLLDVWTGQPSGEVELFKGVLKQKYKTTDHFRLLSKTVVPITDGSSSSCPATYSFDTGVLSIPYINVPTTAVMGGNKFDSSKVEVFKATLTWESQERVFVVKEVEKRP